MTDKQTTQERKELIVHLLEELRTSELYGRDNVEEIKKCLTLAGHQAEKPSKRAEQRPATHGQAETR